MKNKIDIWLLFAAAIFFTISALTNKEIFSFLGSKTFILLIWLGLFFFILSNFANSSLFITLGVILFIIGPILSLVASSMIHPDIFSFLGWTSLFLEGGNILIKTW